MAQELLGQMKLLQTTNTTNQLTVGSKDIFNILLNLVYWQKHSDSLEEAIGGLVVKKGGEFRKPVMIDKLKLTNNKFRHSHESFQMVDNDRQKQTNKMLVQLVKLQERRGGRTKEPGMQLVQHTCNEARASN